MYSLIILIGLFGLVNSTPIEGRNATRKGVNPITKYARKDLFQGDIRFEEDGTVAKIGTFGLIDESYRWPNKTLIFQIDSKFKKKELKIINDGFKLITSKTCIKFREKKKEKDFVFIKRGGKDSGCNSNVGKVGKKQVLNLEIPGCDDASTVAHELMHALGVHHEQCRTDRDDYIKIYWDNIDPEFQFAFDKEEGSSTFGTKYDYRSVMHYDRHAFSINDEETMVPIGDKWKGELGNNEELTETDAEGLKIMYKC